VTEYRRQVRTSKQWTPLHIYEAKYICDQNWVKCPSLVFEIWCSQDFRDAQTHTLMHSLTDRPEYSMSPTPFLTVLRHKENLLLTNLAKHFCKSNIVRQHKAYLKVYAKTFKPVCKMHSYYRCLLYNSFNFRLLSHVCVMLRLCTNCICTFLYISFSSDNMTITISLLPTRHKLLLHNNVTMSGQSWLMTKVYFARKDYWDSWDHW